MRADALEFIGTELLARKDEIGRLLSREEGKPLSNGIAETMRAAQIFKFFAQETLRVEGVAVSSIRPGVDVLITREPLGGKPEGKDAGPVVAKGAFSRV